MVKLVPEECIDVRIVDVPVPQMFKETVEVAKLVFQERIEERTIEVPVPQISRRGFTNRLKKVFTFPSQDQNCSGLWSRSSFFLWMCQTLDDAGGRMSPEVTCRCLVAGRKLSPRASCRRG